MAAYEVLFNTKAVANLIREGKTFQIPSSMQTGRAEGMMTFRDHIDQLIRENKIEKADGQAFLGKAGSKEVEEPAATVQPAAATTATTVGPNKFANPFKKSG